MAFGHPRMDRLIRWYNAYKQFYGRSRGHHGGERCVERDEAQGPGHASAATEDGEPGAFAPVGAGDGPRPGDRREEVGPKAASILTENESVSHEDFNISTNAPQAAQDAQMLRAQISAATRWPQSYYGDASQSNLATATSLELPVVKAVQARQTMFEAVVRFFIDRVIERAVDAARLSPELTDEEVDRGRRA